MENTKPFYDLCLEENTIKDLSIFKKYVEYGYKTIAVNKTINVKEKLTAIKDIKKKLKKSNSTNADDILPNPTQIQEAYENLTILNRLTIAFHDKSEVYQLMKSPNFNKYHIIAVFPKSQEALQAITEMEVDIVSYNSAESKNLKFQRKLYNQIVEKGIYIEIRYYFALADQNSRRNMITQTHKYHQIGKSRNIIISSGISNSLYLRGPYEIINLGLIFGLSEQKSKNAISTNCAAVINHALGRKIGKAIAFVSNVDVDDEDNDNDDEELEIMEISEEAPDAHTTEPQQKKLKIVS